MPIDLNQSPEPGPEWKMLVASSWDTVLQAIKAEYDIGDEPDEEALNSSFMVLTALGLHDQGMSMDDISALPWDQTRTHDVELHGEFAPGEVGGAVVLRVTFADDRVFEVAIDAGPEDEDRVTRSGDQD